MGSQELSHPASVDDLYREWGETPPPSRPLMQGDIFKDVPLPGFSSAPPFAQVIMHPCNMRQGPTLRERVMVVPVVNAPQKVNEKMWKGYGKIFPLPQLEGEGHPDRSADLMEPVAVAVAELHLDRRIATLTPNGIYLLQQRTIFFWTRFVASLDNLEAVNAKLMTEMELQEDWVEARVGSANESPVEAVVAEAIQEYEAWLDEGSPSRRRRLDSRLEHSNIRREARMEIKKRFRGL